MGRGRFRFRKSFAGSVALRRLAVSVWILATGIWNDGGVWVDGDVWID